MLHSNAHRYRRHFPCGGGLLQEKGSCLGGNECERVRFTCRIVPDKACLVECGLHFARSGGTTGVLGRDPSVGGRPRDRDLAHLQVDPSIHHAHEPCVAAEVGRQRHWKWRPAADGTPGKHGSRSRGKSGSRAGPTEPAFARSGAEKNGEVAKGPHFIVCVLVGVGAKANGCLELLMDAIGPADVFVPGKGQEYT